MHGDILFRRQRKIARNWSGYVMRTIMFAVAMFAASPAMAQQLWYRQGDVTPSNTTQSPASNPRFKFGGYSEASPHDKGALGPGLYPNQPNPGAADAFPFRR